MILNLGSLLGIIIYLVILIVLLVVLIRAALAIVRIANSMKTIAARHRLDALVQCKELGLVDENEFTRQAAAIRDQCLD